MAPSLRFRSSAPQPGTANSRPWPPWPPWRRPWPADLLRPRREQLGLSREEVAGRAGSAGGYLQFVEEEATVLGVTFLLRLANALETTVAELVAQGNVSFRTAPDALPAQAAGTDTAFEADHHRAEAGHRSQDRRAAESRRGGAVRKTAVRRAVGGPVRPLATSTPDRVNRGGRGRSGDHGVRSGPNRRRTGRTGPTTPRSGGR
ncbi:helix-turn-helix domain-containing protein [Streptomyces sp. NPDC008079]|uniref:helix-turn-helix domain-containing protein n=1 Tax=Streptomyces sp. NPDC008079 TaxID=3364806 RepID=UPI0036E95D52